MKIYSSYSPVLQSVFNQTKKAHSIEIDEQISCS